MPGGGGAAAAAGITASLRPVHLMAGRQNGALAPSALLSE